MTMETSFGPDMAMLGSWYVWDIVSKGLIAGLNGV